MMPTSEHPHAPPWIENVKESSPINQGISPHWIHADHRAIAILHSSSNIILFSAHSHPPFFFLPSFTPFTHTQGNLHWTIKLPICSLWGKPKHCSLGEREKFIQTAQKLMIAPGLMSCEIATLPLWCPTLSLAWFIHFFRQKHKF